jgi:hypothetical protein
MTSPGVVSGRAGRPAFTISSNGRTGNRPTVSEILPRVRCLPIADGFDLGRSLRRVRNATEGQLVAIFFARSSVHLIQVQFQHRKLAKAGK